MVKIVFIEPDGRRREVSAPIGTTVMEAAVSNAIDGILAQCGGACACATCHAYVDAAWMGKLPPPEDMEEGMLELAWQPQANSRLTCQVHVAAPLEGLELQVPSRQANQA